MTEEELQALVEMLSLKYFKRPFKHRARFNPRLQTTGGRYLLSSHDLELNQKMLTEHSREVLIGTIKHELCHYHLHLEKRGYRHRDQDFKQLLKEVGGLRFAPATVKKARYHYQCCECQQDYLRQRKVDVQKYRCGKCRGQLKMLKKIF